MQNKRHCKCSCTKHNTGHKIENKAKHKKAGHHSREAWELLKRMYNYTCPACGRSEPEIFLTRDHIVPLSKNGTSWIENIQPLCKECNKKKGVDIIYY